jgi:hypothetical protein
LKKITFKALAKGTSGITLSNVKLVDVASATITTQATSGQAIVNSSVVNLCGNAKLDAGEECEVGTWVSATCPPGESGSIGCKDCTLDYTKCMPVPEPGCGDGVVNLLDEECDGGDLRGQSCVTRGYTRGDLACGGNCMFDESNCVTDTPPKCGDNHVNQESEVCDGTDLNERTCQTQGYVSGTLSCTPNCALFDTGACTMCNNNGVCQPRIGETVKNCVGDCVFSADYLSLFFNPRAIDVLVGDTVTFDIKVSSIANLYGYQFDLNYDPAILEFVSLTDGAFLSASPFCVGYNASFGLIKNVACTRMGASGVSGSGTLKTISFKAKAAGIGSIWLSNVKLVDATAATMPAVEQVGGSVGVS